MDYLFIYLCLFISLLLNQGFSYFNANYNLKTRYTVIPSYNVGNIPKLIFFDTDQRYMCVCVCMHVCVHMFTAICVPFRRFGTSY